MAHDPAVQPVAKEDETKPIDIRRRIDHGLRLSRGGDPQAERGYALLRSVADEGKMHRDLPSVFFSYLGYGAAAYEARYNDGIALCQRALEMEFFNTENHFNQARTYMLLGARRKAVKAIRDGLRIDPEDRRLRVLLSELGVRRQPVLTFLSRDHPLNRWLGAARHAMNSPPTRD